MTAAALVGLLGAVGAVTCLAGLVAQDVSGVLDREAPAWSRLAALVGGVVVALVVLGAVWTWTR